MKKIVRILNVRKHKTVTFLDGYEDFGNGLKLMCYNTLLSNFSLSVGDIICFEWIDTVNKKGLPIIEIIKIYWHNPTINWDSPKGIHTTLQSAIEDIRYNSRNAGKQIYLAKARMMVLSSINELLTSNNFLNVKCKSIEEKRTSAKRNPLTISSIHSNNPLYLRITMENQLKQICSIILHSVFSIDNVFYDKAVTANVDREVCILELVSIEHQVDDLIQLIVKIDKILRDVFLQLDLSKFGYALPHNIDIINYSDIPTGGIDYSIYENTLIKDVPVKSPFIRQSLSGSRSEFQWIVKGKMLAHGYEDEFEYQNLLRAVNEQKSQLGLSTCNEMDYMNYAIPRTTSLGLGFDQLLYRFWNLEHIVNISNPLGIYFD